MIISVPLLIQLGFLGVKRFQEAGAECSDTVLEGEGLFLRNMFIA